MKASSAMTSSSSRLLLLLSLLVSGSVIAAAPLQFHDFRSAYLREQSPRALQTSGGTLPDLIAPSSDCFTQGGLQFACLIHQRVGTSDDYVDLNATVLCELGVAQFDFRRSNGCSCSVLITPSNATKIPKTCPCYVCPIGFGSSSLSMDCSMYLPSESPSMAPSVVGGAGTQDDGTTLGTMPPASNTAAPTAGTAGTAAPTAGSMTQAPTAAGTTSSTSSSTATVASAPPTPGATVVSPFLTQAPTASQSTASRRFLQAATDDTMSGLTDDSMNTTMVDENATLPDPFIFATCVTIDCGGNCNGTCSLGCDVSGEQCAFCEGGAGQPTLSPTGAGDGTIQELSGAVHSFGRGAWMMMATVTLVVSVVM